MHPTIMQESTKARQRDLLEEAEHRRLLGRLRAGQPGMIDRLLEKLGDLLIRTAGRFQVRHDLQRTGILVSAEK